MTAITDGLPSVTEENVSNVSKEVAHATAFQRFEILRYLCDTFNGIDKNGVERNIVCELFLRGYDTMAQEVIFPIKLLHSSLQLYWTR